MSYEKELNFATDLAKEAGAIMTRYFRAEDIGTEWKEDNSPLTIADTTINDLVIDRVKEAFPLHSVIGEEASFENEDGDESVWVVDPIDGTVPFSLGMPISAFSLGLVSRRDGQAVLGVTYDPQQQDLYTATRGEGAFLNGRPIRTSRDTSVTRNYLSVLGGDRRERRCKPGRCCDVAHEHGAKTISLYSQVYAAARVASGELVGSIFGYGSPWDSAATSVIIEEAGGVVTDLNGNKRRFDEWGDGCLLAANNRILSQLVDIVDEATDPA